MRLPLILLFVSLGLSGFAQRKGKIEKEEKIVLRYAHEFSGGFRLKTNGWAMFIEKARIRSIYKRSIHQLEFSYTKHAKERKQEALDSRFKDYKFGKWNNFFAFQYNYGVKKSIAEKAKKAGVDISMVYAGGLSIGVIKPYYLALSYPVPDRPGLEETRIEKYSPANAEKFLDDIGTSILGYAGIKHGFSDMQFLWGGHGKIGLNFDWAGNDDFVKSLELGVEAEVYYRNIPLVLNDRNRPFLINLYLGLQFGKRY